MSRQSFVKECISYLGSRKGSAGHKKLVDIFNTVKPDGWPMNYVAAWCATATSAWAIESRHKDIVPLSANCGTLINRARTMGVWIENDAYVPSVGDLIIYSWSDNGAGECTRGCDHVGVVVAVSGSNITVIEGNKGITSVVGYRNVPINGRYIRGFITPRFDSSAAPAPAPTAAEGDLYYVNSSVGLNVRAGAGTNYAIVGGLTNGTPLKIVERSGNWGRSVGAGGWVCMDYLSKANHSYAAPTPVAAKKNYTLTANMNVRTGPGTNYRRKTRNELTRDGRNHSVNTYYGILTAGTVVTALEISGDWMRVPSGWICMRQNGRSYVR